MNAIATLCRRLGVPAPDVNAKASIMDAMMRARALPVTLARRELDLALAEALGAAVLREFAARGGRSTSPAKAAAARLNGIKGGRPPSQRQD